LVGVIRKTGRGRNGERGANGRVLNEVVGADATTRAAEAVGTARTEDAGPTVSTDEAEEMEEHLRGLGYLE